MSTTRICPARPFSTRCATKLRPIKPTPPKMRTVGWGAIVCVYSLGRIGSENQVADVPLGKRTKRGGRVCVSAMNVESEKIAKRGDQLRTIGLGYEDEWLKRKSPKSVGKLGAVKVREEAMEN